MRTFTILLTALSILLYYGTLAVIDYVEVRLDEPSVSSCAAPQEDFSNKVRLPYEVPPSSLHRLPYDMYYWDSYGSYWRAEGQSRVNSKREQDSLGGRDEVQ